MPALCRLAVHGWVKLGDPPSRRVEFQKRGQLLIRVHNEPVSAAMRVSKEDCSPAGINASDASVAPTGFAEIVTDLDEEY